MACKFLNVFYKNRFLFFILIFVLTVFFSRILFLIYDVDLVIFDYEVHHFDYGILFLFLSTMFFLFLEKKKALGIIFASVGWGLIVDELIFIRVGIDEAKNYMGDLLSTIVLSLIFIILFSVFYFVFKKYLTSDY